MKLLPSLDPPRLIFSPLAWLKLQFFCHAGDTEVGGFAITPANNLLYIEDFVTVRQETSAVTVRFQDDAVADFFDECVDAGLEPQQFGRIWCHTHPGNCVQPSQTDEETFARVFGSCDWALMFILARGGATYARLKFRAGPGAAMLLPVHIDWESWPMCLDNLTWPLDTLVADWQREYAVNLECQSIAWPWFSSLPEDLPREDREILEWEALSPGRESLLEERYDRDFNAYVI